MKIDLQSEWCAEVERMSGFASSYNFRETLDPACDGKEDLRCVWEVYDTDDAGRRARTIATFRSRLVAEQYMEGSSGYVHRRQIRIYDTAQEVLDTQAAAARAAALKKLTGDERVLLGLS